MTVVLAFLGALAPFLPVVIQIAGLLIQWFGASEKNLQQYQDMIQRYKDAGLKTVETAQKLQDFHAQMKADYDKTASKPGGTP